MITEKVSKMRLETLALDLSSKNLGSEGAQIIGEVRARLWPD